MEKIIHMARHGESLANVGIATPDPSSIPLTEKGRTQAAALAEWFPCDLDLIIHSPYSRTHETASPLIKKFPLAKVEEWNVHEFTYLDTALCANTLLEERLPRIRSYWDRLDPEYVDGHGAESFSAMLSRIRLALSRINVSESSRIVVFSHGQIMHALSLLQRFPDSDDLEIMTKFREEKPHRDIRNTETWQIRIENGLCASRLKVYPPSEI